MKIQSALLMVFLPLCAFGQWITVPVGTTANFRAVSASGPDAIWLGGPGGTFVRITNSGQRRDVGLVPGAETCDFRDVQAIDAQTAVLMSAGPAAQGQARIYYTADGGKTWQLGVRIDKPADVFLDGMAFWSTQQGLVFSDPIEGRYFIRSTKDGGKTWQQPPFHGPAVRPGEAAFAASGSSIVVQGRQNVWIGSGGVGGGRVFRSSNQGQTWAVAETGLPADSSSGVFGLHFANARDGVAVGGDYKNATKPGSNVAITRDGGQTWTLAQANPAGLKEAAWRLPDGRWVLVGPSGTSLSTDGGKTWLALDQEPFHALVCVGNTCWAVGAKGRVARRTF